MLQADGKAAEYRAGLARLDLHVFDPALSVLLVPEVDGPTLEGRVGPGKHNAMLVGMIGREVVGDDLSPRIVQRMDVAAAVVIRFLAIGRRNDRCVLDENRLSSGRDLQVFVVNLNRNAVF